MLRRINEAIVAGNVVILETAFGDFKIKFITPDMDAICKGGRRFSLSNVDLEELIEQI